MLSSLFDHYRSPCLHWSSKEQRVSNLEQDGLAISQMWVSEGTDDNVRPSRHTVMEWEGRGSQRR